MLDATDLGVVAQLRRSSDDAFVLFSGIFDDPHDSIGLGEFEASALGPTITASRAALGNVKRQDLVRIARRIFEVEVPALEYETPNYNGGAAPPPFAQAAAAVSVDPFPGFPSDTAAAIDDGWSVVVDEFALTLTSANPFSSQIYFLAEPEVAAFTLEFRSPALEWTIDYPAPRPIGSEVVLLGPGVGDLYRVLDTRPDGDLVELVLERELTVS